MDQDRVGGMADKAAGSAKSALGDVTGDARLQAEGAADKATGTLRNAAGGAKDALRDAAEGVSDKVSQLKEDAGPLLEQAGRKAAEYGREARDAAAAGVSSVSGVVRGYPLATVGLVALVAFLAGRASAPEPRPWYRDWF